MGEQDDKNEAVSKERFVGLLFKFVGCAVHKSSGPNGEEKQEVNDEGILETVVRSTGDGDVQQETNGCVESPAFGKCC